MGTMTINVTPSMEQLIQDEMSSGLYESESDLIREAFRAWWRQNGKRDGVESDETDPLVVENEAFVAMHDQLVETHFGRYVAICDGKLIDDDDELVPLALRIRKKYGDDRVLIRQVEREPRRVLHLRHPDHWARQKRKSE